MTNYITFPILARFSKRRSASAYLILLWLLGLLAGIAVAFTFPESFQLSPSYHRAPWFLLTAFHLLLFWLFGLSGITFRRLACLTILVIRAFIFSFTFFCVCFETTEGGWLVAYLLLFTPALLLPLDFWFVYHLVVHHKSSAFLSYLIRSLFATGIVALDYVFVSPFVASLLS